MTDGSLDVFINTLRTIDPCIYMSEAPGTARDLATQRASWVAEIRQEFGEFRVRSSEKKGVVLRFGQTNCWPSGGVIAARLASKHMRERYGGRREGGMGGS